MAYYRKDFRPSFPKNFRGHADLAIFGDAPGEREEIFDDSHIKNSNELLFEALEKLGSSKDEVYISNVFWIRPRNNKIDFFFLKEEETKYIKYSKSLPKFKGMYLNAHWEREIIRLRQEIRLLNPKVILGLGIVPLWAFLGKDQLSLYRGKKIKLSNIKDCDHMIYIPTFHPISILKNKSNYDVFLNDIKLALKTSKSGLDFFAE